MSVKCLADEYVIVKKNEISYVYNSLYEESEKGLFWTAIIELLLPEASDYYIPICIELRNTQDDVIIGKKLDVVGTNAYQYFIAKHQYEKWKKTYGLAQKIIILLSVLIDVMMGYLFWKTHFHWIIGGCFICVLLLSLGTLIKLEVNNHKRKRYGIKDIKFKN